MGVTIELQNLGDAELCREVVARIEHALSARSGDWRVSFKAVRSFNSRFPIFAGTGSCDRFHVLRSPAVRFAFLTQTLHAKGSVVGLVEGIAQATQNIVQGFSGWLSDRLRRRKALALIGYFVSALGKPLMGLASAWRGVLGGRFLDRLGSGFRSAPRDALIASSVPEENRGRAFGLESMGDNLGAFLGPLLTILLLVSLHFNIRSIFYLAVIPGLLAFFMILLVEERPVPAPARSKMDLTLGQFPGAYWKYLLVERDIRARQFQ